MEWSRERSGSLIMGSPLWYPDPIGWGKVLFLASKDAGFKGGRAPLSRTRTEWNWSGGYNAAIKGGDLLIEHFCVA